MNSNQKKSPFKSPLRLQATKETYARQGWFQGFLYSFAVDSPNSMRIKLL